VTVLKLTERLGLTEAGISVSENTDWNKQRVAATGQGITRMLVCCKDILKEKKRSLNRQRSVIAFFKSSLWTRASPPVLLDIGYDDLHDQPAVQEEVPHLYNVIFLSDFVFFVSLNLFLCHNRLSGKSPSHINIAFTGKPA
jgi:hypothetical protein